MSITRVVTSKGQMPFPAAIRKTLKITARFSSEEITEIREGLTESEAECERGEGLSSQEVRKRLGLS